MDEIETRFALAGLSARRHDYQPGRNRGPCVFYLIRLGRRELGSWVPATCSARVGPVLVRVSGVAEAVRVYGEYAVALNKREVVTR